MTSRIRLISAIGASLLLAGSLVGCGHEQPAQGPVTAEVAFVTVQPERIVLTADLPGRTSAYQIAEIKPQVSGLIQKRLFTEGSDVEAGQALYQIDPAPLQATLDQALANLDAARKSEQRAKAALEASEASVVRQEASLKLAQINRDRMEDLYKDHAVSTSERDQAVTDFDVAQASLRAAQAQVESDRASIAAAQAAIKQAEAAVQTAKIDLNYAGITAPISGRIGRSHVTPGAIVTAYQNQSLATIQQMDPIYVDVPQSTSELLRLKKELEEGQIERGASFSHTKLLLEDGTEYTHEGELRFQDVTVDPTTGTVTLRMVFPNPENTLLPGMFVKAVIEQGVNDQAILIPQQAVSRDPKGDPLAMVVDAANKVEQRHLVIERAVGNRWLVTKGIAAGDRVIVEGLQKIRPGADVRAVPFEEPARLSSNTEQSY